MTKESKSSKLVDREERAVKALELFASAVSKYLKGRAKIEEQALVSLLKMLEESKK